MKDIELLVEKGNISYRRLGEHMGVTGQTVYRWFKRGVTEVERLRIIKAINEIKNK